MRIVVGLMLGLGIGFILSGTISVVSPFRVELTNFGIMGLGFGLLVGGIVAVIILRQQKPPSVR